MKIAEREYLSKVADLGCIICGGIAEIHHIRTGQGMGKKSTNFEVIPLCHFHHRTGNYGDAFHQGKKAFEAKYGTQEYLMQKVAELLNNNIF